MPKDKSFMDHTIDKLQEVLNIKKQLAQLQGQLSSLFTSKSAVTTKARKGRRRKFSAATLAKMRASQQARWAKKKGPSTATSTKAKTTVKAPKAAKVKKGMSAAARKKLSEAMKARWAARRKAA